MSFIAVAAAGLAAVSAGSSLYNQYKQGKTLADTDWGGMAGDVMDSYKDNLANLKDSADVVFDKIDDTSHLNFDTNHLILPETTIQETQDSEEDIWGKYNYLKTPQIPD